MSAKSLVWKVGRRALLWVALVAPLVLLASFGSIPLNTALAANPITVENQQPGSDQWELGLGNYRVADDVGKQVEGYASATSVNKGSPITFYVTVKPVQTYTLDIYRMGWYQGLGGRLLQHIGPLSGVTQPACPRDASTGLIACNWSAGYTLNVPTTWTDGIYLALLTNAKNYQSYIIFVVRDDARVASLMYQQPVTTYQAYNNWPDDGTTGKSLYEYNSYGANTVAGTTRAVRVSFDRPYSAGGGLGDYDQWEINFVHWLEKSGYDVTYSTNIDTHVNGGRLVNYKGFLSVGHDEYWSKATRDALEYARTSRVNLAFFGANTGYWQIRLDPSAGSVPNRIITCYKDPVIDPMQDPTLKTVMWRNSPLLRPEQTLEGAQFTSQTLNDNTVPYVVTNSGHWVYAGTGLHDGDSVAGIVGYEADRSMSEFALPQSSGTTYTLLAHSPYTNSNSTPDFHNSAVYQAPSGAQVFSAGTMSWSWALDAVGYVDARIQQTTANILNNFVASQPPVTPTPTLTPTPRATSVATVYSALILADNPVGYWRFGESGGAAAWDERGTYNAVYVGGPGLGQPGAIPNDPNPAAAFNGAGQYVQGPYSPNLNTATFSAEVWAYANGGSGTYRGVMASRAYPRGWVVYAGADNHWQFWVSSGSGMIAVTGAAISSGRWDHIVATFDGTTARLYVNGVLTGSGVSAGYSPNSYNYLVFGQAEPGQNFWFPGALDEAAVYNVALSATQVQTHYNAGAPPPPTPTATPTVTPTPTPGPTSTPTPTVPSSTYYGAVLNDNPVAYWRLGESSGATATDARATYNGSYVNSPTLGQPGAIRGDSNTAVSFNGTSQFVSVPYSAALNPSPFSVEVWAYPTGGAGAYRGVISSRAYPNGWVLYAASNNDWQFWINNVGSMSVLDGGPMALNQWTHLVGVFDGTTARLYVNGTQVASGAITTYTPNPSGALNVGQGEAGGAFFFPGALDEPAVYNVALSATQVQNHYTLGH
ncbi:MAG: LamG domain-containing protein [Anaerolineae bacterium]